MIKEAYCSYEVSKMLKEKEFPQDDVMHFPYYMDNGFLNKGNINKGVITAYISCLAPTQQIAMRWLREIHKLHITVFSSSQESWMYRITKQHQKLEEGEYGEDFVTYEEAVEAALKYTLENLI